METKGKKKKKSPYKKHSSVPAPPRVRVGCGVCDAEAAMLARATRGQRCAPASPHRHPTRQEVLRGRAPAAALLASPITAADSRVRFPPAPWTSTDGRGEEAKDYRCMREG